jgi:phage baseplate assembly protein V
MSAPVRHLLNVMRGQAAMAAQSKLANQLGTISAYDPNSYSVKVAFPPDESETGWIPLGALWVGSGWGMYAPPSLGDQVEVHFQEGGQDAGTAGLRFFDNLSPPVAVQPGEFWLVHESGAFFKLVNAGGMLFSDAHGATVQLDGAGNINTAGNWTHTGNMTIDGASQFNGTVAGSQTATFTGEVQGNGIKLSVLKVTGVTAGSGVSGTPQAGS